MRQEADRRWSYAPRLFFTAAAAALSVMPALADTLRGPVGSRTGGTPFHARCEQGEILVGLAMRANEIFDAVAPMCARLASATTLVEGSTRVYPRTFGGPRGNEGTLLCSGNTPVVLSAEILAHGRDAKVSSVALHCNASTATATTSSQRSVSYEGRGSENWGETSIGDDRGSYLMCPPGEVGVGIWGRSGGAVDALGLICDEPVLHSPATPAPPRGYDVSTQTRPGDLNRETHLPRPRPRPDNRPRPPR